MQKRYRLDKCTAKEQIKTQIFFKKFSTLWHYIFVFNIGSFILKFAKDNPHKEFGIYFCIKILFYLILFICEQVNELMNSINKFK